MQTILFYGRDGAKAKARAIELRKASKDKVLICDVTVWEGTKDGDRAEIMDCVSYFDRQRIEHVFGVTPSVATNSRGETWDMATVVPHAEIPMGHAVGNEFPCGEDETPKPKKRGRKPKAKAEA